MKYLLTAILILELFYTKTGIAQVSSGRLIRIENFKSVFVKPRNIDVWLPDSYKKESSKKYCVLYMNDGQNLFTSATSYFGSEWMVDETLARMLDHDSIRDCIVVGVWNTDQRFREYQPAQPFQLVPANTKNELIEEYNGVPLSDAYLKFIVKELKPFIDSNYNTFTSRENTFIIGSSMGGLISLYAALEYPMIFGGVACISTHWPVSLLHNNPEIPMAMAAYIAAHLSKQNDLRLYFDYGTKTLDSLYEPYQTVVDSILRSKGFTAADWITKKFDGDIHSETSWQKRFHIPVYFLIGK